MSIVISNQINLSSATASIKNGSYNSVMIFNIPAIKKEKNILYNQVSIINAQIPVSYYTINDNNNLLSLSTGDFTLTNGNYNATSFSLMITTVLGSQYTLTLDNSTGKFTFHYNSAYTINATTTCWKILGLAKNTAYVVSSGLLECPFPANFLGVNRIKIKSGVFKTNNLDSNSNMGHSDLLATIPVNVSPYSLISYNNLVDFKNTIPNEDITYIDITITDEDDTIIDFNNIDVHMTIQIDSIVENFEGKSNLVDLLGNINN